LTGPDNIKKQDLRLFDAGLLNRAPHYMGTTKKTIITRLQPQF